MFWGVFIVKRSIKSFVFSIFFIERQNSAFISLYIFLLKFWKNTRHVHFSWIKRKRGMSVSYIRRKNNRLNTQGKKERNACQYQKEKRSSKYKRRRKDTYEYYFLDRDFEVVYQHIITITLCLYCSSKSSFLSFFVPCFCDCYHFVLNI